MQRTHRPSLGRPNREQVVTTRGEVLTTLQALDLSNGQSLTDTAERGAGHLLDEQYAYSAGDTRHLFALKAAQRLEIALRATRLLKEARAA